jgi:ADP-ribose pyrophosphatase YjhB (NUDIX family)
VNFCSHCAAALEQRIPDGDTRSRWCCPSCGTIHYENPKLVVGTVSTWDGKVLLCRRAIEPRRGYWTLPAGFLEIGETTSDGAFRETLEEAGAAVDMKTLFSAYDVLHVAQIHLFYLASMRSAEFEAGIESLEVRLFDESEIPWSELAFRTVAMTLEAFFSDRTRGRFEVHVGQVLPAVQAAAAA